MEVAVGGGLGGRVAWWTGTVATRSFAVVVPVAFLCTVSSSSIVPRSCKGRIVYESAEQTIQLQTLFQ